MHPGRSWLLVTLCAVGSLRAGSWETQAPLPRALAGQVATVAAGIFVLGGEDRPHGRTATVWRLAWTEEKEGGS